MHRTSPSLAFVIPLVVACVDRDPADVEVVALKPPPQCVVPTADTDGDGATNAEEAAASLDCLDPDVDDDGIPDGVELHRWLSTGVPVLTDPRHKDVVVEVQYEVVKIGAVVVDSAAFDPTAEAALLDLYAQLPVDNPDGLPGITVHLRNTTQITGTNCSQYTTTSAFPNDDYIHIARACFSNSSGGHGASGLGVQKLKVFVPKVDADPTNDATEPEQFFRVHLFAHELGHSLGLRHGGTDNRNHKPNYVSLMNYRYGAGVDGSAETIAGSAIQFSTNELAAYPLDECNLHERTSFPGLTLAAVDFLDDRGTNGGPAFTVGGSNGAPWVDWNRDGVFNVGQVQADLNADCYIGSTLTDSDDIAVLNLYMRTGLDGNPEPVTIPPSTTGDLPNITPCTVITVTCPL